MKYTANNKRVLQVLTITHQSLLIKTFLILEEPDMTALAVAPVATRWCYSQMLRPSQGQASPKAALGRAEASHRELEGDRGLPFCVFPESSIVA